MPRPQITKIQIWVNGKGPIDIDPANTDAIFFTDQAVRDILAPYYSTGAGAARGIDAIAEWNTPTSTGTLPAYMIKIPMCSVITG
jgi:hypothetical protein